MSRETDNREPSRSLNGEGSHADNPNSQMGPQPLGGVSEDDRTGRAARVSRENSSGASVTPPAGVVGVPRSGNDPSDRKTDGERRWGTWVRVKGTRNGTGDGQGNLDKNSA
jgi:hypothetical protein